MDSKKPIEETVITGKDSDLTNLEDTSKIGKDDGSISDSESNTALKDTRFFFPMITTPIHKSGNFLLKLRSPNQKPCNVA